MAGAIKLAKIPIGAITCLLLCCCWSVAAAGQFDTSHRETAADPTRNYLPGKYYERVALDAMRRKDYVKAISAYKKAAYWADKVAQYDLGEIYFHGMANIHADPARGVAWFGIADEEHQPDYDKALVSAYKTLSPEQRKRADAIWEKLQAVYGDKLTLARATRAFENAYHSGRAESATTEDDPNTYTFSVSGYDPAGNIQNNADLVSDLNGLDARNGVSSVAGFWAARKQEFAKFITNQFGHVEIGPIEQVSSAKVKPVHKAGCQTPHAGACSHSQPQGSH